jgi:mannonate dehydratase
VGSYGVRADNDLPGMVRRHGERLHFAHLRSVSRGMKHEKDFLEDDHLNGDTDMFEIMKALVLVNRNRQLADGFRIPYRPDHGHRMLDDFKRASNPGYSLYGRMRGIAELRGLEHGIERMLS